LQPLPNNFFFGFGALQPLPNNYFFGSGALQPLPNNYFFGSGALQPLPNNYFPGISCCKAFPFLSRNGMNYLYLLGMYCCLEKLSLRKKERYKNFWDFYSQWGLVKFKETT